jgi:hypothetical protein
MKILYFKKICFISVHMTKSLKQNNHILLKENKIRGVLVFSYKIQKYIFACILDLITSLLKSWELGLYFKNKKIFCFFLICGIMNLYVRYIPDIKLKNTKFFWLILVFFQNMIKMQFFFIKNKICMKILELGLIKGNKENIFSLFFIF